MGFKVAVVGATGNVGREMLNILDERLFPADEVIALASRKSIGVEVSFGDKTLKCKALENYDFSDVDLCLMTAGGAVSKEWSPKIGAQGAVVIDNSSAWRMDPRRAADRAGGERRRDRRLPQEEHHRQSELLDRAARRRAEAAARPRQDQARRGRDLPIGVRRRQGRHGRARPPDQGDLLAAGRSRPRSFPSRSPSTSSRTSTCSWRTATPRKSGRWWSRPRRSSIPRSSSPPPACACRCSSAIPKPSTSSSRIRSRPTRRATSCATRRAAS